MNKQHTDIMTKSMKDKEHKAFEEIFSVYFPKVKYYINGFVKPIDIAEDLTQDVFLKVWKNCQWFVLPAKSLDSYIFTIATGQIIDYIKNNQIRNSFYNDQMSLEPDMICIEDEYIVKETRLLIEMKIEIENMPGKRQRIYRQNRDEGLLKDKLTKRLNLAMRKAKILKLFSDRFRITRYLFFFAVLINLKYIFTYRA